MGNSLTISTNVSMAAVKIDGFIIGNKTFFKLYQKEFPRVKLASTILGGNLLIPLLIAPKATALNLQTYVNIKI